LGKRDLSSNGFDLITSGSNASGFASKTASEFSLGLLHESQLTRSTVDLDAENKWVFVGMTFDGTSTTENLSFYEGSEKSSVVLLGQRLDHAGGATVNNSTDFTVGGDKKMNPLRLGSGFFPVFKR